MLKIIKALLPIVNTTLNAPASLKRRVESILLALIESAKHNICFNLKTTPFEREGIMKWIQIGAAKSGNLWIYHILQKIRKQVGLEQKSFIQNHPINPIARTWGLSFPGQENIDYISINPYGCIYNIGNIFNMPMDNFDDYLDQCSHVWLHSFFCSRSPEILTKFDKIIYIVRDPRDIAISMSRYSFTPYRMKYFPHSEPNPASFLAKHLAETVFQWVRHVGGYLIHKNALKMYVIFYERLLYDFDSEIAKLLDYLEINVSPQVLDTLKDEVSFSTMKEQNPNHLRKGEYGEWRDVLSKNQVRLTSRIAGPMLKFLNYPLGRKEESSDQMSLNLPSLPAHFDKKTVNKILAHASKNVFIEKAKRKVKRAIYSLSADESR